MTDKITVSIGPGTKVETWRDGEWAILYVEDGSGAKTTVSLNIHQAIDLATLLRGYAIGMAHAPCDCGAETTGKWANQHEPSCAKWKTDTTTKAMSRA